MPKSRPTRPRRNPSTLADLRLRAYREIPAGYDHDPYLAAAVLAGLLANTWFGLWWADPVIALGIAALAVHEGREAWEGEEDDDD